MIYSSAPISLSNFKALAQSVITLINLKSSVFLKVNQVIYSSDQISLLNINALAQRVITLINRISVFFFFVFFLKVDQVLHSPNKFNKYQNHSSNTFEKACKYGKVCKTNEWMNKA